MILTYNESSLRSPLRGLLRLLHTNTAHSKGVDERSRGCIHGETQAQKGVVSVMRCNYQQASHFRVFHRNLFFFISEINSLIPDPTTKKRYVTLLNIGLREGRTYGKAHTNHITLVLLVSYAIWSWLKLLVEKVCFFLAGLLGRMFIYYRWVFLISYCLFAYSHPNWLY